MTEPETIETPTVENKNTISTSLSVVVGIVVLVLLALAFSSPASKRPQIGDPAPDFTVTLLGGSDLASIDLQGRVVVINFWASWCAPCRNEAPELQSAWEAYQDKGVTFVGITYQDAKNASQRFVDTFGLTYPNGVDEKGQISRAYGITGIPETFIIDREGNIAWSRIGEVRADELAEQLERLLGE